MTLRRYAEDRNYQMLLGPSEPRGAQTYSVYNYHTKQFDYYEAPLAALPATGTFRSAHNKLMPEGLATPLPVNSRFMGRGREPLGMVAVQPAVVPLGAATTPRQWPYMAVIVVAAAASAAAIASKKNKPSRRKAKKRGWFGWLF